MTNPQQAIIVKDDGHIDPKVWFGRYGIKYKSLKGKEKQLLKIKTSSEGMRRWRLGVQECKKQGTEGWHTLELRLYIMKHGTADGFQFNNFDDYQKIVEFYA